MTVPPHVVAPIVAGGAVAIGWYATRGGRSADDDGRERAECGHVHASNAGECEHCGGADRRPGSPGSGGERADRREGPVADTVVRKTAESEGVDPSELDRPLFDVVDPDALEQFVRSCDSGRVTFEYRGCEVTVTSGGRVAVDDGA